MTSKQKRNGLIGLGVILTIFLIWGICNLRSCTSDEKPVDTSTDPGPGPSISAPGEENQEYTPYLIGDEEMTLTKGEDFSDPGIEIRDENGVTHPELLKDLVIEGEVDTATPGKYVITYKFGDIVLHRTVVVSEDDSNGDPNQTTQPDSNTNTGTEPGSGTETTPPPSTTGKPEGGNGKNPDTTTKPAYDMSGISVKDLTVTYDGLRHYISVSGKLPDGVRVTFDGNGQVNAGTYTVVAHFIGSDKYQAIPDMSATLTIVKADYNMTSVEFNDRTVRYDGQPHSILIDEETLPEGVTVKSYTGNGKIQPGEYTVTVYFSGDTNHNAIKPMTAKLTIVGTSTKPSYDMSKVFFKDATVTFNNEPHGIEVSGTLPNGVSVSYTGNGKVDAGTYKVTAHFTGSDDYQPIPDMVAILTIEKADYDMSSIRFNNRTFIYDGRYHSIYVSGKLPEGVKVNYSGNYQRSIGTYSVTAMFTGDSNHNAIKPMTATMTIKSSGGGGGWTPIKPSYDMSEVSFTDKTVTYDGLSHSISVSGKLPAGVTVSYTGNGKIDAGTYTVVAHFTGSADYKPIPSMSATLTINKATFDVNSVNFDYTKPFTFDGKEHSVNIKGTLPVGVTYNSTGNKATQPGEYQAVFTFFVSKNYEPLTSDTRTVNWEIVETTPVPEKKDFDPSAISVGTTTFTYNGREHSVALSGTLPNGVTVKSVTGEKATDAGEYKAIFTFALDTFIYKTVEGIKEVTWKINPATLDKSKVTINAGPFTYDGTEHKISATTTMPGVTVEIEGQKAGTAAGDYTATVVVKAENPDNYTPSELEIPVQWKITDSTTPDTRKDFDPSEISVGTTSFTYNGSEHSVALSGTLPNGVTVKSVTGEKATDAGEYKAIFTFALDTFIYKTVEGIKEVTWKINPATLDKSKVTINAGPFTYDGTEHKISATTTMPGVTVEIEGQKAGTAAGDYTATVVVKAENPDNYTPSELEIPVQWKITDSTTPDTRKDFDPSEISVGTTSFTYNGSEHSVALSGTLPNGVTVKSVTGEKATDAGEYKAIFTFALDTFIYKTVEGIKEVTWKINPATLDKSKVTINAGPFTYDGTEHKISATTTMPGVTVEIEGQKAGTAAGDYTATVVVKAENPDNYTPSELEIPVQWKIADSTTPDTRKDFDPSEISIIGDTNPTYDGSSHSISLGSLPAGVSNPREAGTTTATDAGTYSVTYTFDLDPSIYKDTTGTKTVNWSIAKAPIDKSSISFPDSIQVKKGSTPQVQATYPDGVSCSYTTGEENNNQYTITAHFSADSNHEMDSFDLYCVVTITDEGGETPVDPVDPENPTNPTDPVDPPTDPVDPENPTDPVDPPTDPVNPENPTDPVDPPTDPVDPENPTDPVDPPTDPVDPEDPENPKDPPADNPELENPPAEDEPPADEPAPEDPPVVEFPETTPAVPAKPNEFVEIQVPAVEEEKKAEEEKHSMTEQRDELEGAKEATFAEAA